MYTDSFTAAVFNPALNCGALVEPQLGGFWVDLFDLASESADLMIWIDGLAGADAETIESTLAVPITVTLWGVKRDTGFMTNRLFKTLAGTVAGSTKNDGRLRSQLGTAPVRARADLVVADDIYAAIRTHYTRSSSARECALALSMVRTQAAEYVEILDAIHRYGRNMSWTTALDAMLDVCIRLHTASALARGLLERMKDR